jgi:hypothetical protein
VFLADEAVVFVFEGPQIEGLVRDLVNERVSSAGFAVWAPLLQWFVPLVPLRFRVASQR